MFEGNQSMKETLMNRFIRTHPVPVSAAAAAAVLLLVAVGGSAALIGLFHVAMMASMVWMMVAMAAGHGHRGGDSSHGH